MAPGAARDGLVDARISAMVDRSVEGARRRLIGEYLPVNGDGCGICHKLREGRRSS